MRKTYTVCYEGFNMSETLIKIARESPASGNSWDHLTGAYNLPASLKGLKALDIASGLSNFPQWLANQGAQVWALDVNYNNTEGLISRFNAAEEIYIQGLLDRDYRGSEVRSAREKGQQVAQDFRESLKRSSVNRVAGSALHLPFSNNYFDLITSSYGLFATLDSDADILEAAIAEAIRTLSPQGSLQILPALVGRGLTKDRVSNQWKVTERLQKREDLKLSLPGMEYTDKGLSIYNRTTGCLMISRL